MNAWDVHCVWFKVVSPKDESTKEPAILSIIDLSFAMGS
jgi:hypothetical protein